ncbi:MAG: hypothetical protein WC091_13510 [Sulfuricellaceae bacterium]
MVVLNNFVIYFACTRMVRARLAGLHGFPDAWRRCNYKRREENGTNHSSSLRLLPIPDSLRLGHKSRQAVGYALHPENHTLQPVQRTVSRIIFDFYSVTFAFAGIAG